MLALVWVFRPSRHCAARMVCKSLRWQPRSGEDVVLSKDPKSIEPPQPWSVYAPKTVERADGTIVLENAFTRATKRPPIFLPGMTPTTSEAPIVAAAANAGYMAELAGGGQPSEAIFRRRAEELKATLKPGEGYVVNTLYLDPYLWGLQVGKDRVVQKLRAEGTRSSASPSPLAFRPLMKPQSFWPNSESWA